ncbi:unnamed protein product [Acanthosepion pharaonis]|uniref:ATP-dependent DNA helicase n=1 Tax=Acanthosepion pharaonis TaxID=158019 RepID=A0A812DXG1_ACAPH|nr:unnamed protein product [Sepia pharaonis]
MSEDILYAAQQQCPSAELGYTDFIYNRTLIQVEDIEMGGAALTTYGLPPPVRDGTADLSRETSYCTADLDRYVRENELRLLPEQRTAYTTVIDAVRQQRGGIFFLDAPGGTGKMFITKLILAEIRRHGNITLAVASSRIAAILLSGGQTAHSMFRLPLDLAKAEIPTCSISKDSGQADVFRRCKLLVWGECTMTHRQALEVLNRSLQDSTALMGGLTLLLSDDFRQTLPVILKGTRADAVRPCLKSSNLWVHVQSLHLTINMRAHTTGDNRSADFSRDHLALGKGRTPSDAEG